MQQQTKFNITQINKLAAELIQQKDDNEVLNKKLLNVGKVSNTQAEHERDKLKFELNQVLE